MSSRSSVGGCDLLDHEAIHPPARVARPPVPSLLVIAVIAPEAGRIEFRHGDGVLPQLIERLQRATHGDHAIFVEQATHDLKHGSPLGSNKLPVRYTPHVAAI